MFNDVDLSQPFSKVSVQLYNEMCAWIEKELGKFNIIVVGRKIRRNSLSGND